LENRNFKGVVEESWRCFEGRGWMGFLLKEKLKYLKGRLKDWNKEEYTFRHLFLKKWYLIFEWMVWKQWQNLVLLDVLMDGKNYHSVIVSCNYNAI
jgi:hypothetical protein